MSYLKNSDFKPVKVYDTETKLMQTMIDRTPNSYLITLSRLTEEGIDCDQWFIEKEFIKRFKYIEK